MRGLVVSGTFGRRCAAMVLAVAVAASAGPVRAEEGGFFGFLSALTGGGSPPPPAAAPAPSEGERVRPLTVRRTPRKVVHAGAGRARMARIPTKAGPVSIYEDPTLRHGDAVMTRDGMRVFAGGRLSPDHPYGEADFVAVSDSKAVAPSLKKTVIELNKLPHS